MRSSIFLYCALTVTLILLTCSSDNPTEYNPGDGSGIDTVSLTFGANQAAPASMIKVTGLPSGNDNLYGIVLHADASVLSGANSVTQSKDTAYTPVIETDSGTFILAPLNPVDPANGGVVVVTITDDSTIVSKPVELSVDALPAAPDELADLVSLLSQVFDHQLRIVGLSRDDLEYSDPHSIPAHLLPYVFTYDALDSPDNPNSLKAFAEGSAPVLENPTADIDLANRLLGLTGYREYLEDLVASLDTLTSLDFAPADPEAATALFGASPQICIDGPQLGIANCDQLANAMRKQSELASTARSAGEKVKSDVTGAALTLVSLVPGAKVGTTIFGAFLFVESKAIEGQINLYPSQFVDAATSFNPSITEFTEDFQEPGNWTHFDLTAKSNGWKLDKLIFETILQAIAAKGGTVDEFRDLSPELKRAAGEFNSTVEGAVKSAKAAQTFNELAEGEDFIEICAATWEQINCAEKKFMTALIAPDILDANLDAKTYEPTDVGSALFRLETSSEFGPASTRTEETINVEELEVSLDPFQADADTSEQLTFYTLVRGATDKGVDYDLSGGGTFLMKSDDSVRIKTPPAPWSPDVVLTATSRTTTGLFADGQERPSDSSPISYDSSGVAILSPGSVCVKPEETQDFTVNYVGGTINSTRWELDPAGVGTFSNKTLTSATYKAPSEKGQQVNVKAIVNDRSTAVANVTVSGCVCDWIFEGEGSGHYYSASGAWGPASTLGALTLVLSETEDDPDNFPVVGFAVYNFTGVDTYQTEYISFTGNDEITWAYSDANIALPIVEITEYVEGDYVAGTAYGQLSQRTNFNPPEYEYITFSVTFRGEFFRLDRPQCVDD